MNEVSTILEVRQLSFAYGHRQALQDVSFSVNEGEILSILGPNGSGKSTLFKLLSTLVPPQNGSIECKGIDYRGGASRVRNLLGVVFQSPGLDKKLTVEENLMYQAALYGMPKSKAEVQIEYWLKRLKVDDRGGEYVEKLSGGLARRVEIAKALLHKPNILILDEPSTGLDPRSRVELWDSLEELSKNEQVTVLVTTHLMDEAMRSHRVLILDRGKIVALGTPGELIKRFPNSILSLRTTQPEQIASYLRAQFDLQLVVQQNGLRAEIPDGRGAEIVSALSRNFSGLIETVTLSQAGLEDVFFAMTGKVFAGEEIQ